MRTSSTASVVLAACAGLVAALPAAVPARASAQAMDSFGMGSRGASLAGAVGADVEDATANYYNPAGIVRGESLRLLIGYLYASPQLSIDDVRTGLDDIHGIVFGLAVPGRIGPLRLAFGLGGHLPDARVSRSRSLPRRQPRWELYDNRPHRPLLAAHVAVEPVPWLRAGVGMAFQATSDNDLAITGDLGVLGSETLTSLEQAVNVRLQTIRYPQLGLQVDPLDWLSVGLTYRHEFGLASRLLAEVDVDILALGLVFPGYVYIETQSVNAYQPKQLDLGVSVRPLPGLRIGFDLTWVNWSAYKSPIGSSNVILTIDVPPGLEGLINVPDSITPGVPIPAEFRDRWVPRVGVEYQRDAATDVALAGRAGYLYESSPAPPQTGLTNLIDCDRHVLSAGVGVRLSNLRPILPGFLELSLHFQWSILPDRQHVKTSPIDPVGDYHAGGQIFAGGATLDVGLR